MKKMVVTHLLPIFAVFTLLSALCLPYAEHMITRWFESDVKARAQVIFNSASDNIEAALASNNGPAVQRIFQHIAQNANFLSLAYCDSDHHLLYPSGTFPPDFDCGRDIAATNQTTFGTWDGDGADEPVMVGAFPMASGHVVMLNDLDFVHSRIIDMRIALSMFILFICAIATFATLGVTSPILSGGMQALRNTLQKTRSRGVKALKASPIASSEDLGDLFSPRSPSFAKRFHKNHTRAA